MTLTNVCIKMFAVSIWTNAKSTWKTWMTMATIQPVRPPPPPWPIRRLDNASPFVATVVLAAAAVWIIITIMPLPTVRPMVEPYTLDSMPIPIVPFTSNPPARPIPLPRILRACPACLATITIPPNRPTRWSPIPPWLRHFPMTRPRYCPPIIHYVRICTILRDIAIRN